MSFRFKRLKTHCQFGKKRPCVTSNTLKRVTKNKGNVSGQGKEAQEGKQIPADQTFRKK